MKRPLIQLRTGILSTILCLTSLIEEDKKSLSITKGMFSYEDAKNSCLESMLIRDFDPIPPTLTDARYHK